jgi:tetratricopeptide (TPR) repeat protein
MPTASLDSSQGGELRRTAVLVEANPAAAVSELVAILRTNPLSAEAYRQLAAAKGALDRKSGNVLAQSLALADQRLMRAAHALSTGDLETVEVILRPWLCDHPDDVRALQLLASFAVQLGCVQEAEQLLRLVLELVPGDENATLRLASVLHRQNRPAESVVLLDELLERQPGLVAAIDLRAAALARAGRIDESAAAYRASLELAPNRAPVWTHYGQLLKTAGLQEEAIGALRRATRLDPLHAEAWWSLADLKTVKLGRADIDQLQAGLASGDLSEKNLVFLHFALGKAFEDLGEPAKAFSHYAQGNRIHRARLHHDADELDEYVAEASRLFSSSFFDQRRGSGDPAVDPIFVLGMPRSGSTLIEQILASHPQIEGTAELPDLPAIAGELGAGTEGLRRQVALGPDDLAGLGADYLRRTRRYRLLDRPRFVDKMPNNWIHVPLIHLILPNARIIDVRRHPLACCFSNFKQHFRGGQPFAYDLTELGRYYSSYVSMMRHIDAVLPGRVHRIIYEELIDDVEQEVRRLLEYLGLPFHPACLAFHQNPRAVRSASSEQVRRPANREGLDQWKPFEPWLGPLKDALGPVLDCYPNVPE